MTPQVDLLTSDPNRQANYIAIAAGSGITEYYPVTMHLETESKSNFLLIYGNRNRNYVSPSNSVYRKISDRSIEMVYSQQSENARLVESWVDYKLLLKRINIKYAVDTYFLCPGDLIEQTKIY